jgi:hypothetical protein
MIIKVKPVKGGNLFPNLFRVQSQSIQFNNTWAYQGAGPVDKSTIRKQQHTNIKILHNYLTKERKAEENVQNIIQLITNILPKLKTTIR